MKQLRLALIFKKVPNLKYNFNKVTKLKRHEKQLKNKKREREQNAKG